MHEIAHARRLALVAVSAAVGTGAIVAPANATEPRVSAVTVAPFTTRGMTDPDPRDDHQATKRNNDDVPKMRACTAGRCVHEDTETKNLRKQRKKALKEYWEQREKGLREHRRKQLWEELKRWDPRQDHWRPGKNKGENIGPPHG